MPTRVASGGKRKKKSAGAQVSPKVIRCVVLESSDKEDFWKPFTHQLEKTNVETEPNGPKIAPKHLIHKHEKFDMKLKSTPRSFR